jgi:putative sugar O-methyltransferase
MYEQYTKCISSFVNSSNIDEWTFKSHPDYSGILEHVWYELGVNYMNEIQKRFNSVYNENKDLLIDLCDKNDSIGKPTKHFFENFTLCSPTNLRYIYHSMLILTYMQDCMLNNIDIIEIGGGYGGLCFYIHKMSHLFNIKINSYTIFDLKMPLILQKKYLDNLDIQNINYSEMDDITNLKKNSFLISNYAFSEISYELQKKYTNNVLNPYVSHGLLVWNWIDVYPFIENKDINVEKCVDTVVRFKPNN